MKLKIAVLAAILAASVLGVPALADHSWNGYHWADRSPNVADAADPELYDVVAAVNEWNGAASGADIQMEYGEGKDIKVVSRNAAPFYYGLAEIFVEGGHITRGRVTLNDRYLKDFINSFPDVVLCQELGHVLGLDHNRNASKTCMDDTLDPNNLPNGADSPNLHDAQMLTEIYLHPDALDGGNGNGGGGGPPCDKKPDHPKCQAQGRWILVHIWKFDPANHPFPASQSYPASQSFPADGLPDPAVGPPEPFPSVVLSAPGPPASKPPLVTPGPPDWLPPQARVPENVPPGPPA